MDKYELSKLPDVLRLADMQEELHLNDKDFCRRVGFALAASSWGKIKAGTWSTAKVPCSPYGRRYLPA